MAILVSFKFNEADKNALNQKILNLKQYNWDPFDRQRRSGKVIRIKACITLSMKLTKSLQKLQNIQ